MRVVSRVKAAWDHLTGKQIKIFFLIFLGVYVVIFIPSIRDSVIASIKTVIDIGPIYVVGSLRVRPIGLGLLLMLVGVGLKKVQEASH